MSRHPTIVVVGGGIVGMTTALALSQKTTENTRIVVLGERWESDTTSHGAAGLFGPTTSSGQFGLACPPGQRDRLVKWVADSWRFYRGFVDQNVPSSESGVSVTTGYRLFSEAPDLTEFLFLAANAYFEWHRVDDIAKLTFLKDTSRFSDAFVWTTLMIESRYMLPWLRQRLLSTHRVALTTARVASLKMDELCKFVSPDARIVGVVNCAGILGAELSRTDFSNVRPVRGQLVRVSCPAQRFLVYADHLCHAFPVLGNQLLCGAVRQPDKTNTIPDPTDTQDILHRVSDLCPALKEARVVDVWSGLRPWREAGVRLEVETQTSDPYVIVHNYGHGSNGISLSYGCANEAANLLLEKIDKSQNVKYSSKL